MNVLVIDIGGTHVKILATGQKERRVFDSGLTMTPQRMVAGVKKLVGDWKYDVVSIGYPGPVRDGRVIAEPHNLAKGWVGFDFKAAFRRPIRVINDAAMQALGSYRGGTMFFAGLGTGFGTALVLGGVVVPMELGSFPLKKRTYDDYLGQRGLERLGKKKWRELVEDVLTRLIGVFHLHDVVVGGGNVKELKTLPAGSRAGDNDNAFLGGFLLWESECLQADRRQKGMIVVPKSLGRSPSRKARLVGKKARKEAA